jgi:hypothetical protein
VANECRQILKLNGLVNFPKEESPFALQYVGCCIILLKPCICHPLPRPSQFHSQKYLQHDATALRLVIFLEETRPDHTNVQTSHQMVTFSL